VKHRPDKARGREIVSEAEGLRRLREGVVEAASRLLTAAEYQEGVSKALEILLEAAQVDRVYIFEQHSDPETGERVVSQRFGWSRTRKEIRIDPPELQNIHYMEEGFKRLDAMLSQGQIIAGPVREFPEQERKLLQQFDLRSILILPILNEQRLWGLLGFDDCRAERVWSEEECSILQTMATNLGALVERQRAQERYRILLEGVDAVVWEANVPTLQFTFVSRRVEALLGYTVDACLSDPGFLARCLHPEDRDQTLAAYQEAMRSARDQDIEYRFITADGRTVWLCDRVHVVCDRNGRPVRMRGVMVNTTSRKRAEESRERLAAILEATTDVVGIVDVAGGNHYLNSAGRRLLGLGDTEELPQSYPADFHPPWALKIIAEVAAPAAATGGAWSGEAALLTRDGREIPVSQVVIAHKTPAGKVTCYSTVARDISERKRYERQITALLDVVKDISGTLDLEEIFDRAKRRTASLLSCDQTIIFHWNEARRVMHMVSQHGIPDRLLQQAVEMENVEYAPGREIVEQLARGCSEVVNDLGDWGPHVRQLLERFGVGTLILAPLTVRGRLRGAFLAVRTRPRRPFDAAEIQLFEGIAAHLGLAMEAAELYRTQQEEAIVSTALARVGQEMISSLNNPLLLNRLCQVTTEVLGCDCSHTLWRNERTNFCIAVAGYGDTPEQWVTIERASTPLSAFAALTVGLESEDVAEVMTDNAAGLRAAFGITSCLGIALRRGGELVGIQIASYRGRERPFTDFQRRIAKGIARVASMALANTRLVEELMQANRLKADFVATMSHELRTPLNVIIGYNDLLLEGAFGRVTPEQCDTMRRMNRSAWELLDLINATLDVSRIESGQVPVDLRDIDLCEFMSQIEAETQETRAKPGIDFAWNVSASLPPLRSDPVKLKVVVKNLISNAVKFTDGGRVTVHVGIENGGVQFQVADTGIGISHEMLDVIFQPFRQIDSSLTRRHGGVGLGLYIARRLLELIGGTISVSSQLGGGSCFRVWVPHCSSDETTRVHGWSS
jgi:PAS domain S-box-containing protein